MYIVLFVYKYEVRLVRKKFVSVRDKPSSNSFPEINKLIYEKKSMKNCYQV